MNEDMKEKQDAVSLKDIYARYCIEIDKEDRLINDRVNWLLVSQSILFAAIGFARERAFEIMEGVIPVVGCALSVAIWISVVAAIRSCMRYRKLLEQSSVSKINTDKEYPQLHRDPVNLWMGHLAPVTIPGVFIVAWSYLIAT